MTEEKKKRLTPTEWAEAEQLWALGEVTLDDLEAKFGMSAPSFSRHFKKQGIEKGEAAREYVEKVKARVEEKAMGSVDAHAEKVRKTKEKHFNSSEIIHQLAMAEIAKAKKEDSPMHTCTSNLKAIKLAGEIVARARVNTWEILGLDKEDFDEEDLPDLVFTIVDNEKIRQEAEKQLSLYANEDLGGDDDDGIVSMDEDD
jgi:DNA-binding transcriptional ArsR family regulator